MLDQSFVGLLASKADKHVLNTVSRFGTSAELYRGAANGGNFPEGTFPQVRRYASKKRGTLTPTERAKILETAEVISGPYIAASLRTKTCPCSGAVWLKVESCEFLFSHNP